MLRLWQGFSSFTIKAIQRFGPHTVRVIGRSYDVSNDVFNPKFFRTSEFMARYIRVRPGDEVLDMGTGSGIQAITAGQLARKVIAVDINPSAVQYARKNVARNGMGDIVSVLEGDLFSPLPAGSHFDVILFTPPYLEGRPSGGLGQALYDPGKSLVRRFLEEARDHLKPKGYVQMVYTSIAEPERVLQIADEFGWDCRVVAKKKGLLETYLIWELTLRH